MVVTGKKRKISASCARSRGNNPWNVETPAVTLCFCDNRWESGLWLYKRCSDADEDKGHNGPCVRSVDCLSVKLSWSYGPSSSQQPVSCVRGREQGDDSSALLPRCPQIRGRLHPRACGVWGQRIAREDPNFSPDVTAVLSSCWPIRLPMEGFPVH
ncbi:hypothetical protein GJAV_G00234180 [Gymnothorax javanicus]|nr:hypothetical protein GJAV_G00234180 [Gymnothorax javanicus]